MQYPDGVKLNDNQQLQELLVEARKKPQHDDPWDKFGANSK